MALRTRKLGDAFGVEVLGLDLSQELSPDVAAALLTLWHDHLLVLFRQQTLDPVALKRFSRIFGDLDAAPPNEQGNPGASAVAGHPDIAIVSNVVENGVPIGSLGAGELEWHTDMSYMENPPIATVLHAKEVPAEGGDTLFVSMERAMAEIPADVGPKLAGAKAIHDSSYNSAGQLRKGRSPVTDVRETPGARHDLVRRFAATGRDYLYLGRRRNSYVLGQPVAESERILDTLWAASTRPDLAIRHRWNRGDVLVWDNLRTMHRRDPFHPETRRIMHRTQIRARPN